MTLHDYAELVEYWANHPPAHLLAAAKIGHKPRRRDRSPVTPLPPARGPSSPDLGALLGAARDGVGSLEALSNIG